MENEVKSKDVEKTLAEDEIHNRWEGVYRSEENERFYGLVFDYLFTRVNKPEGSSALDVGCGIGAHSVRLAERGFNVLGVDFAENVLSIGEKIVKEKKLDDKIRFQREDILKLSLPDNEFDCILCWGVLMHIPEVEKAISELSRVLKKGGVLVVSEGNMHSLQARILRAAKRILRREKSDVKRVAAGYEQWSDTPVGTLLTRQADIRWLKQAFGKKGLSVRMHIAGQFTELYTRFSPGIIQKSIHCFNRFWFRRIKFPGLAFGNIIVFRKGNQ